MNWEFRKQSTTHPIKSIKEFTPFHQSAGATAAYKLYQDDNSHNDQHFTDQYFG